MEPILNDELEALKNILEPFAKELSEMIQPTKDELDALVERYSVKVDECKELNKLSIALKVHLMGIVVDYIEKVVNNDQINWGIK